MSCNAREWIRKNVEKATDFEQFVAQAARECGVVEKTARDAVTYLRRKGQIPRDAFGAVDTVTGLTFRTSVDLEDVKREYDEEAKIQNGLAALGPRLIKDNDFRVELGVPIDRWRVVSGLPKFSGNKRELKGKRFRGVYWGSTTVIKDLSRKIDILP